MPSGNCLEQDRAPDRARTGDFGGVGPDLSDQEAEIVKDHDHKILGALNITLLIKGSGFFHEQILFGMQTVTSLYTETAWLD
jgi:hypothetical protein